MDYATLSKGTKKKRNDSTPKWTTKKACMTFTTVNPQYWYEILSTRYFKNLQEETGNVEWKDTYDKEGDNLRDTVIKLNNFRYKDK